MDLYTISFIGWFICCLGALICIAFRKPFLPLCSAMFVFNLYMFLSLFIK